MKWPSIAEHTPNSPVSVADERVFVASLCDKLETLAGYFLRAATTAIGIRCQRSLGVLGADRTDGYRFAPVDRAALGLDSAAAQQARADLEYHV